MTREEGRAGCVRASEELLAHARSCGVPPDRVEDLRRHIEWRLLLDRANENLLRRRQVAGGQRGG
jgi:hypothetical protein